MINLSTGLIQKLEQRSIFLPLMFYLSFANNIIKNEKKITPLRIRGKQYSES